MKRKPKKPEKSVTSTQSADDPMEVIRKVLSDMVTVIAASSSSRESENTNSWTTKSYDKEPVGNAEAVAHILPTMSRSEETNKSASMESCAEANFSANLLDRAINAAGLWQSDSHADVCGEGQRVSQSLRDHNPTYITAPAMMQSSRAQMGIPIMPSVPIYRGPTLDDRLGVGTYNLQIMMGYRGIAAPALGTSLTPQQHWTGFGHPANPYAGSFANPTVFTPPIQSTPARKRSSRNTLSVRAATPWPTHGYQPAPYQLPPQKLFNAPIVQSTMWPNPQHVIAPFEVAMRNATVRFPDAQQFQPHHMQNQQSSPEFPQPSSRGRTKNPIVSSGPFEQRSAISPSSSILPETNSVAPASCKTPEKQDTQDEQEIPKQQEAPTLPTVPEEPQLAQAVGEVPKVQRRASRKRRGTGMVASQFQPFPINYGPDKGWEQCYLPEQKSRPSHLIAPLPQRGGRGRTTQLPPDIPTLPRGVNANGEPRFPGTHRKHTTILEWQRNKLIEFFETNKYPLQAERLELASKLDLPDHTVAYWFMNYRVKWKESMGGVIPEEFRPKNNRGGRRSKASKSSNTQAKEKSDEKSNNEDGELFGPRIDDQVDGNEEPEDSQMKAAEEPSTEIDKLSYENTEQITAIIEDVKAKRTRKSNENAKVEPNPQRKRVTRGSS